MKPRTANFEAMYEAPLRVRLPAGDRAHEDDVPAVADVWQAEPGHPEDPVDVRVEHRLLVGCPRLGERRAPERESRVVEQDVDPAERLDRRVDERGARRLVGHVDRERDVRLDALDAARAPDDANARLAQLAHRRRADAGRGTRDDCGLSTPGPRRDPSLRAGATW